MNKVFIAGSCFFAGLAGFLFFLIQGQYLVIKLPWFSFPVSQSSSINKSGAVSREIVCYLWRDDTSIEVKKNMLWPQDLAGGIKNVVSAWIDSGIAENLVVDDVKLLSIALTQQETVALISFDKSFIPSELQTRSRWQLVESLLQTLRAAGVVLEGVYFLQGQEFLHDDYLDFTQRWPISGYRSK